MLNYQNFSVMEAANSTYKKTVDKFSNNQAISTSSRTLMDVNRMLVKVTFSKCFLPKKQTQEALFYTTCQCMHVRAAGGNVFRCGVVYFSSFQVTCTLY